MLINNNKNQKEKKRATDLKSEHLREDALWAYEQITRSPTTRKIKIKITMGG